MWIMDYMYHVGLEYTTIIVINYELQINNVNPTKCEHNDGHESMHY